jgi:hypothetical protein
MYKVTDLYHAYKFFEYIWPTLDTLRTLRVPDQGRYENEKQTNQHIIRKTFINSGGKPFHSLTR